MDEDLSIINTNTRNEKIKNFFVNNKKLLISSVIIQYLLLFIFSILQLLIQSAKHSNYYSYLAL